MKKTFGFKKASMLLVACSALSQVNAYADGGIVEITGQISPTTCVLSLNDAANTTAGADKKTVNFGDFNNLPAGTVGQGIGTAQKVFLSLGKVGGGGSCVAGSQTTWNVVLDLETGSVSKLSDNKTYLKNQDATGTDAVVMLKGSTADAGATAQMLTLTEAKGFLSTPIVKTPVPFATGLVLEAQLAYAGTTAPKAGAYTATVPLLVVYK